MREGLTRLGRPTGTQTHPLHSHTLTGISDTADKDVTPSALLLALWTLIFFFFFFNRHMGSLNILQSETSLLG